jgi:hypothetical protein
MDFRLEQRGEARAAERIKFHCNIFLDTGKQLNEGRVVDLSEGGCLVESPVSGKVGDNLQLRLSLPVDLDGRGVCRVQLSAGRRGVQFSVEFLSLEETVRVCLTHLLTAHADAWSDAYASSGLGIRQDLFSCQGRRDESGHAAGIRPSMCATRRAVEAGNTPIPAMIVPSFSVHPRACGEHLAKAGGGARG